MSQAPSQVKGISLAFEPERVAIPAGYFRMGSEGFYPHESPAHRVWVDAWALGRFTVTNQQYRRFLEATGHPPPPFIDQDPFRHPDQPVVGVSWFDALAYCEWLSAVTGRRYRLPTEAEWEHAARGGVEGRLYSWGNTPPQATPDYGRRWPDERPEPVGLYPPNGYGLYNMGDNVHEWCADWFAADYYQNSPGRNPQGPAAGVRRAARGGSWRHQIKASRCAARSAIPPHFHYSDFGFRVAMTLGPET